MTTTLEPGFRRRYTALDLPASGVGRYGVLLLTVLVTALFAATSCYAALFGTPWDADLVRCRPAAAQCLVPESLLQSLPLLAAVVLALGAGLALYLAPSFIAKRRGLQPVGARFPEASARMAGLVREMRLRRAPTAVRGRSVQDAFCFGRPGRVSVAVPTALLIRPADPVFEVVIRHELAHVRQGDVALAGLARSAWWALAPLLALPLPLAFVNGHAPIVPDYLWRAAVFAVVVLLVQRELLRAREHEADLHAARGMDGVEPLLAQLSTTRRSSIRQLLGWHPDGPARRAALLEPSRTARFGFGAAIGAGFLTALALSLLHDLLRSLLTPASITVSAGLIIGPVVGATLGLGLCRQAVAYRHSGAAPALWPAISGLLGGALGGQAVSFVAVGNAGIGNFGNPALLLVVAIAMAGATALAGGLCALAADRMPMSRRPIGPWLVVAVLSALVFCVALVTADQLADALSSGAWPMVDTFVLKRLAVVAVALGALCLAVAAACYLGLPRDSGGTPPPVSISAVIWCGLLVGVSAAAVLAAVDVTSAVPDATELTRRVDLSWWAAGAAGTVTALVLRLRCGPAGAGAALLSSVVATLVATAGFLIETGVRHGLTGPAAVLAFVVHPIALGLLLQIAVAWLPVPRIGGRRTQVLAALTAGGLITGAVLALGPSIEPHSIYNDTNDAADLATYSHTTALDLRQRFATIFASMVDIDRGSDPIATRIVRLDTEVAAPLDQLILDEKQYQAPDAQVADLQAKGVGTLVSIRAAITEWRMSLVDNSGAELHTSNQHFLIAIRQFEAWSAQFGS